MKRSFCVKVFFAFLVFTAAAPAARAEFEFLPRGRLFSPLLADPKELRFSASSLYVRYPPRDTRGGSVSAGGEIGIFRDGNNTSIPDWQIGVSGGVFGEFDMNTPNTDLVNADFSVGFPVTFRQKNASIRLRPYHQGSRLGDNYVTNSGTQRIDFSYDSLETLFSIEDPSVRIYLGGEYLTSKNPGNLGQRLVHGGIESRSPRPYQSGTLGDIRLVAAVDLKSWEEVKWSPAWSIKGGLELSAPMQSINEVRRSLSFLLIYYDGFTPYGQFYTERVDFWGFGLSLAL